eukprot:CAMPEP_0176054900 /NCGR_PEP_ID=MMETSP0120_2-20121206/27322_1 /TAXON_ID=160619 /ORGANISM="Kryptoperidinium foliaceum, Strain CCMP 1326" /LENGTH=428 /DNA_ID=CAMNT_0017388377 /DNA_START=90 /DNA_END=1376 /DNA_ORIENTATION=-
MDIVAEKAFLEKQGVYDHIGRIVDRVVAEKPTDAQGLVEVLSRLVKESAAPPAPKDGETEESLKALEEHVKKARELDKLPETEDGEVTICTVPDFNEEAEMFASAGIGLGETESYKVMCSLRNMAAKKQELNKVRFWGKVLGTDADYYIAEAAGGDGGEAEEGEEMDAPGTGANTFTYFYTTDLSGSWEQLPHIKPSQIVAARMIKRLLTGNPKAKVITHPFFDAPEEVLLRAQIARISADTVLCVKGVLIEDEEGGEPGPNEEFVMPPASELLSRKAWTHMVPHILNNGRTAHKELPDQEEDPQGYAAAKEEQEADPPMKLLRGLDEDGLQWVVKQTGDTALYKSLADGVARSNAVTSVRCLTWPGAVCIAQKTSYANLYIGYGLRAGERDFFPPAPPDVQDEPVDPGEVPEPQGTEEEEEQPVEEE